jgi:hypothetical protein
MLCCSDAQMSCLVDGAISTGEGEGYGVFRRPEIIDISLRFGVEDMGQTFRGTGLGAHVDMRTLNHSCSILSGAISLVVMGLSWGSARFIARLEILDGHGLQGQVCTHFAILADITILPMRD